MSMTLLDISQEQDLAATFLMKKYMPRCKQIKGKFSPKLLMFTSDSYAWQARVFLFSFMDV